MGSCVLLLYSCSAESREEMRNGKETQCLKALIPTEHKLSTDWHQSAKFPLSSWVARDACTLNGWAETVSNRYEKKLIFYFKNASCILPQSFLALYRDRKAQWFIYREFRSSIKEISCILKDLKVGKYEKSRNSYHMQILLFVQYKYITYLLQWLIVLVFDSVTLKLQELLCTFIVINYKSNRFCV